MGDVQVITEPDTSVLVAVYCGSATKSGRIISMFLGFFTMVAIGISFVSWTELAQCAATPDVSIPFVTVYSTTLCLILVYPAFLMITKVKDKEAQFNLKEIFRDHLSMFSKNNENGFRPMMTVFKVTVFVLVWTASLYVYVRALALVPASNVTVLFAVHSCYVYLFSWIILHTHFIAIRVVAFIFGMTGTILMIYKDGFGTESMWGSILVPAAASGMAGFRILFVRVIGRVNAGQYSLFLSTIGIYSSLLMSPVLVVLCVTGVEKCSIVRWEFVVGASGSHLVFYLLSMFGVLHIHQVFLSLGLIFSIPLCAVADIKWKSFTFSGAEITAAVLITIGFMLNLLPKNWHLAVQSFIQSQAPKRNRGKRESFILMERRRRSRSIHYLQTPHIHRP